MLPYESCRQLVLIECNTPIWFTKTVRFSAKRITEAMPAHYISALSQFSFSSSESPGSSAWCLDADGKGEPWSLVLALWLSPSCGWVSSMTVEVRTHIFDSRLSPTSHSYTEIPINLKDRYKAMPECMMIVQVWDPYQCKYLYNIFGEPKMEKLLLLK